MIGRLTMPAMRKIQAKARNVEKYNPMETPISARSSSLVFQMEYKVVASVDSPGLAFSNKIEDWLDGVSGLTK